MTKRIFGDQRMTIGLVLEDMKGGFAALFWKELASYCESLDVNLVMFPGQSTGVTASIGTEVNATFALIDGAYLHGLIFLSNTLTNHMDSSQLSNMFKEQLKIPSVSLGVNMTGVISNINIDNRKGLEEAIGHLIDQHHCKKIAFIKGHENHKDTIERFNIYKETIESYGLVYDPQLVATGDFFVHSGEEAIIELLDNRQVEFDAVLSANDDMAIGVMQELLRRKIAVPSEVKVVGFDNIDELNYAMSPLATVAQPRAAMVRKAVDQLLAYRDGHPVEPMSVLPTTYIPRKSCGCVHVNNHVTEVSGNGEETFDEIFDGIDKKNLIVQGFEGLLQQMLTVTLDDTSVRALMLVYDRLIAFAVYRGLREEMLEKALNRMANQVMTKVSDGISQQWADSFFIRVRYRLDEFSVMAQNMSTLYVERSVDTLMVKNIHEVIEAMSLEELAQAIQNHLPKLNVNSCFIGLYDHPIATTSDLKAKGPIELPEYSKLLLGYCDGDQVDVEHIAPYKTSEIIPLYNGLHRRRFTMVVEPISINEVAYGYIFYELGHKIGGIYETIIRQISTAIKLIRIVEETEKTNRKLDIYAEDQLATNRELERTLILLKETENQLIQAEKQAALGHLVAGIAHEINTPLGVSVSAVSQIRSETKNISQHYMDKTLTRKAMAQFMDNNLEVGEILLTNLVKAGELITSFKGVAVDQTNEAKRVFDLLAYSEQVVHSLHPKIKHSLVEVVVKGDQGVMLNSYPGALSQVLTNLVINALIHGFKQGEEGVITILVRDQGDLAELTVQDNGRGIPLDELSLVFDAFYTTKKGTGGTGLGLSIVKSLISEVLKGTIKCRSAVNKGSTFIIKLPKEVK